ncbi:basic salivary proline-rich protein 2-like [Melozone crissalis]|uniref:basic salivary proline-rich protein 2-like n=1 Tax=Melozone crissalis TaxID=40204 RepID=UPI0023D9EAFC|nr:basic salivary proline-rich protein 2-like [Melozone crissalis]
MKASKVCGSGNAFVKVKFLSAACHRKEPLSLAPSGALGAPSPRNTPGLLHRTNPTRLPKSPPPGSRPAGDGDAQASSEGGFHGGEHGSPAGPAAATGGDERLAWPPPVTAGAGQRLAGPGPALLPHRPPGRLAGRAAAPVPPQGLAPPRARGAQQTKGAEAGTEAREEGGGQAANRPGPIHWFPLHRSSPPRPAVRAGGSRAAARRCPGDAHPAEAAVSRSRRGPLPGHLSGAARPPPAPGLSGEQPPGVAERHSPRRRRRSWLCCCFRGARPGFGSGSLPRRAAASLFLAPPPPLPPPPLPPPLRPRRGARGRRARDGRRLPQARLRLRLRLRRPRTARRRQEGRGHPRSVLRPPGRPRRPADSTSPLRPV